MIPITAIVAKARVGDFPTGTKDQGVINYDAKAGRDEVTTISVGRSPAWQTLSLDARHRVGHM